VFINELEQAIAVREKNRPHGNPIRLSNTGKCPMATYLKMLEFPERPLDPRVLLMFKTGDLSEQAFKNFAKDDLEGKGWEHFVFGKASTAVIDEEPINIYKQLKVLITVDDLEITGHLDGIGLKTWNSPYVIEFKTMSNFAFRRFEKGEIDSSYNWQCQAYMEATGIKQCLLIAQRKETGHMAEQIINREKKYDVIGRWSKILKAKPTSLPTREGSYNDAKEGGVKLAYPCSYCSFGSVCFENLETEFQKGKPVMTAERTAEPKEITQRIIEHIKSQDEDQKEKVIKLKGGKNETQS